MKLRSAQAYWAPDSPGANIITMDPEQLPRESLQMIYREERTGGANAGALLLALSALDVLLGATSPGFVHFAVAGTGVALMVLAR